MAQRDQRAKRTCGRDGPVLIPSPSLLGPGLMLGGSLERLCAAVVVVVMLQLQSVRILFLLADVGAPAGTNWLCYAPIVGCHQ